ncbi:MAG: tetratricopeptide repeat protein [Chloroflexi bacterium]|nr:tetratricopeptide repeat protein [Chloroflexota bacterium]
MTVALLAAIAFMTGAAFALRPLLRRIAWPAEAPDRHDDVARAVSSLRDLEFAVAAGTIDPADAARLRARIEAAAFPPAEASGPAAPVRRFALAAVLAGLLAIVVVARLPASAGDRAPGQTITGTVPAVTSTADLEARVRARPADIPSRLALAEAYEAEGRDSDAAAQYTAVLSVEPENVPALNGLGLLLFRSGSLDGAALAADRVLSLRPRDPDALFLKGLALYEQGKYAEAVAPWTTFLDVGQFHYGAPMVRSLIEEAKRRAGT